MLHLLSERLRSIIGIILKFTLIIVHFLASSTPVLLELTEAKQSVTSLRRMAFRMAVNISVKEKQIATSARNLVRSRKSHYLDGRDAEKRVEELKRSLRIEEGRNKEILEALERASMLTLQCEHPAATIISLAKQHYRCQSKNAYTSPTAESAFSSSFTTGTTCQKFRIPTADTQNADATKFF